MSEVTGLSKKSLSLKLVCMIDTINRRTGEIFMYLALVVMILLTVGVLARYIFHSPLVQVSDTVMFAAGGFFVLMGAYAHLKRTHVNVDLLRARLSLRAGAILDVITSIFFFAYVGIMLWMGWEVALRAIVEKQALQSPWWPPLWPVRITIPIGAFLLLLQGIARLIRDLHIAVKGRRLE